VKEKIERKILHRGMDSVWFFYLGSAFKTIFAHFVGMRNLGWLGMEMDENGNIFWWWDEFFKEQHFLLVIV
jgi:hypothetical protein